MRVNDAVSGAILIVLALLMMNHTRTFPRLHGQEYGPDLFPLLIGAGLVVCGGLLVARGLMERRLSGRAEPLVALGPWARDPRRLIDFGCFVGGIVLYTLLSEPVGFIPLAFGLTVLLMLRFGARAAVALPAAAATTLVIHTMFAKVLLVPLPWGLLLPVAW